MKRFYNLYLSLLCGFLLFAAWPVSPLTFLIFVAFVPLLLVADQVTKRNHLFLYSFIALLVWNATTTWWIWNSTDVGSIAAIVANSLLMCLPWWGYHIFKAKYTAVFANVAWVVFIMMFEYIHLNWQLSWPWLTLGNAFANQPSWVQWYEFTGVSGGTLWILITNMLFKNLLVIQLKKSKGNKLVLKQFIWPMAILILPFIVSWALQKKQVITPTSATHQNVLIVQPNIDPYQKFENTSVQQQVAILLQLTAQHIDSATQLVLWPETALSAADEQVHVKENYYYKPVFDFLETHPNITILSGIETFKRYGNEKATSTARKSNDGTYYDAFNTAVALKNNTPLQFYNKSKLVPGVESLPTFLNFMSPVFEQFGGTTGGYGRNDSAAVLTTKGNPYIMAPVICYESIYGEYVSNYVLRGANIITIITNDGWWGNTPGHKQHLCYANLRAIETRRWIARSANTGISAIINPSGTILQTQPWNKAAVIKYAVPTTTTLTFYTLYGDIGFKIATVLGVFLITFNVWAWAMRRLSKKKHLRRSPHIYRYM